MTDYYDETTTQTMLLLPIIDDAKSYRGRKYNQEEVNKILPFNNRSSLEIYKQLKSLSQLLGCVDNPGNDCTRLKGSSCHNTTRRSE